jgi:hypothetical protein
MRLCDHLERNSLNVCRSEKCLGQKLRDQAHILCPAHITVSFVEESAKGSEGRPQNSYAVHVFLNLHIQQPTTDGVCTYRYYLFIDLYSLHDFTPDVFCKKKCVHSSAFVLKIIPFVVFIGGVVIPQRFEDWEYFIAEGHVLLRHA